MTAHVLVLNSFIKGWNIIKALADDGFAVNAGDYRPGAPGLFSNRIADRSANLLYPDPKIDENRFVQAVLDHLAHHKVDVLLPVNAAEMMALARHKIEIAEYCLFPFEDYYRLLLLHDKKYFYEILAGTVDLQYLPRSWSVGNQTPPISDIIELAGVDHRPPYQIMDDYPTVDHFLNAHPGVVFPLIVKTRRATSAVGVFRVNDAIELRRACERLGGTDIIIQENVVGRGVGISCLRWDNPAILCHFGHKRVREYPISGGASTSREVWDIDRHPLSAILTNLLEKVAWRGVVMFEFKEIKSEQSGFEYKFLEANPRFWGSVPLAIVNGVNFPALLCRAALGLPLPPVVNRKKVRARIFFSDTLSLVQNLLKGRNVVYNLKDYLNPINLYIDDIDWRDWGATYRVFGRMLSELLARKQKKS